MMKCQESVLKKLMWGFFLVASCAFLTFFMLHITDTFFPSLGMIAKVAVPIGTFFVLGIIAFLIQTVLGSALQKIHVLDDVRMLFHIVFLILILAGGLIIRYETAIGSMFDMQISSTELFEKAQAYHEGNTITGLNPLGYIYCVLLGNIIRFFGNSLLSAMILQLILYVLSALMFYFAICLFTGKGGIANVFLITYSFALPMIYQATNVTYDMLFLLMLSAALLIIGGFYRIRTDNLNTFWEIVFALLGIVSVAFVSMLDYSGLVLIFPLLYSFFIKGEDRENLYYRFSMAGCLVMTAACLVAAYFFSQKYQVDNSLFYKMVRPESWSFALLDYRASTQMLFMALYQTALCVVGFLSVFSLWKKQLQYIVWGICAFCMAFLCVANSSTLMYQILVFVFVAIFSAYGICNLFYAPARAMNESEEDDDKDEESAALDKEEKAEENNAGEDIKTEPVKTKRNRVSQRRIVDNEDTDDALIIEELPQIVRTPKVEEPPKTEEPPKMEESPKMDEPPKAEELPKSEEEKKEEELVKETIKTLNEQLNVKKPEFVPHEVPKPRRPKFKHKEADFMVFPSEEMMKYDVEIEDDDDFDLK